MAFRSGRFTKERISDIFSEIGFRYPNRDASAWVHNNTIIAEQYNGSWSNLLLSVSCDATALVDRLNNDGFKCIKGVKIAPMYARLVDEYVTDLHNVWDLDMPIDTHLRKLSRTLMEMYLREQNKGRIARQPTDDEIREWWREMAEDHGIARNVVDAALWLIGNKWDEWGEEYWYSLEETS